MLRTVLSSETDLEKEQKAEDTAIRKNNADGAGLADESATVKKTSMASISGGSGTRYRETKSGMLKKKNVLFQSRNKR